MLLAGISLICTGMASAAPIQVGGTDDKTRIVFPVSKSVVPDITEQNQTLIVNFPYTVGEPQTIQETFLIQQLTFDGTKAVIVLKVPCTYRVSTKYSPTRVVLDISSAQQETEMMYDCPIRRVTLSPEKSSLIIRMHLEEGIMPEVRSSKSDRIFITFPSDISCPDMDRLLAPIPQFRFQGMVKMSSGTAMSLAVVGGYQLIKTRMERRTNTLACELGTRGPLPPDVRQATAESLFSTGNTPGVIDYLEPHANSLSAQELRLLARAYWALAFPYRMGPASTKALNTMNAALLEMPGGVEREETVLEYCSMLARSGLFTDAEKSVQTLKESASGDIRVQAAIMEMDILNRKGAYEEAYAASKRILKETGEKGVPAALQDTYRSTLADTYLGLNDHAKALELYTQALAGSPSIAAYDPGLYARMGEAAFKLNDFSQAQAYLVQAINLGPPGKRTKQLLMLGDSLYQIGQKDKAMVAFSQVETYVNQGEDLVIARLKIARIIIEKNTDEKGRLSNRAFNEVMDIYENLKTMEEYKEKSLASLVKVRIAQAYAKNGKWDKALDTYQEVWAETKASDTIHHYAQVEAVRSIIEKVRILHRDSRYDQICELYMRYRNTFIKELSDSATLFIIGDALYRTGNHNEARAMLVSSIRGESSYKEQALFLLFSIDARRTQFEEALIWNTLYLSTYPNGRDVQIMRDRRGEVLYMMGNLKEAIPYLEASASSNSPLALNSLDYLSDAYRRLGLIQQEQQALDRIISLHPNRVSPIIERALYRRANQLKAAGDLTGARNLYKTLLDAYPRSVHAHWTMYHLAQIAYAMDDQAEAASLITNVMNLSKDPILIAAARATSGEMELRKELRGLDAFKGRMGGQRLP